MTVLAISTEDKNTVVEVGDVGPPTDFGAQFVDDGTDLNIETDYQVVNRYEKDRHVYMMGVTSPGFGYSPGLGLAGIGPAFVQMAAPTLLWVSRWTACRYNTTPKIPDPTPTDPNWILLDEHYEPTAVTLAADGVTPRYRISGTYVYGHKNPAAVTVNNINYARPPSVENTVVRNVPTASLEQQIINT